MDYEITVFTIGKNSKKINQLLNSFLNKLTYCPLLCYIFLNRESGRDDGINLDISMFLVLNLSTI